MLGKLGAVTFLKPITLLKTSFIFILNIKSPIQVKLIFFNGMVVIL